MSFYNFAKYNFLSNFRMSEIFLSSLNHHQVKVFPLMLPDLILEGNQPEELLTVSVQVVVFLIVIVTMQQSEPRFCSSLKDNNTFGRERRG